MTREIQFKRKGPESAKRLVVFLHGYGADGADLLGLADVMARHLPETAFVAPDAPDRSVANPMGFQWFPIPWIDGSSDIEAGAGMAASADDLNAFLDKLLQDEGVNPGGLALFGFSQGTMMSLRVAPGRDDAFAAVVGFSGRLMQPERLAKAPSKPPILLIHGDADHVVSYDSMAAAEVALTDAGFSVQTHTMPGTGHGIDPGGLTRAVGFLRAAFALD